MQFFVAKVYCWQKKSFLFETRKKPGFSQLFRCPIPEIRFFKFAPEFRACESETTNTCYKAMQKRSEELKKIQLTLSAISDIAQKRLLLISLQDLVTLLKS